MRLRLAWMLAATTALSACATDVRPRFEPKPCAGIATAARVTCGTVQVPERYGERGGRQIDLHVLVLHATGEADRRVAQYDLEGGPGFAVTRFLDFYLTEGAPYRAHRDIVLADRRGTGSSHALRCPALEAYDRGADPAPMYPPALVAECARTLSRDADLAAYTTAAAARDIEQVRQALGYDQWVLNAVSYGTTLGWHYMADHPERVRAALFMGTVPADQTPPRFHATAADRALSMLVADCAGDPECARAYGDIDADLAAALGHLAGEDVAIRRAIFMEKVRALMYSTTGQRQVPYVLHRAAMGDFEPFNAATRTGGESGFADGLYLSVTCAESFPRFDVDAAIEQARHTRFGDYRLARQSEACRHWPVRRETHLERTNAGPRRVPVLFVAGDMDPVSPPQWAMEAQAAFPDSRVVVVPRGGHVLDGMSGLDTCFDRVAIDLFDRGSVQGLDTSCFATMQPGPYRVEGAR